MTAAGRPNEGDKGPINTVTLNTTKLFAFAEFDTLDSCTAGLGLDGIMLDGNALKIRRPKDYVPLPEGFQDQVDPIFSKALDNSNIVSTTVPDSPFKVFIGGIPSHLTEEQVKQLLLSFGQLRSFNLVKDGQTGKGKGYAFCEYMDHSVTDAAISGLHGQKIGDKALVVQRSIPGHTGGGGNVHAISTEQAANAQAAQCVILSIPLANILQQIPAVESRDFKPTNVLLLLNLFHNEKDLLDEESQADALADIRDEMVTHGDVQDIRIKRISGGTSRWIVEVAFADATQALKAQKALSGKKFNGRAVVTSFGIYGTEELEEEAAAAAASATTVDGDME